MCQNWLHESVHFSEIIVQYVENWKRLKLIYLVAVTEISLLFLQSKKFDQAMRGLTYINISYQKLGIYIFVEKKLVKFIGKIWIFMFHIENYVSIKRTLWKFKYNNLCDISIIFQWWLLKYLKKNYFLFFSFLCSIILGDNCYIRGRINQHLVWVFRLHNIKGIFPALKASILKRIVSLSRFHPHALEIVHRHKIRTRMIVTIKWWINIWFFTLFSAFSMM